MAHQSTYDQFFNQMVFDNSDTNGSIILGNGGINGGDVVDSFLSSLLEGDTGMEFGNDQSIDTPTEELADMAFPLPDIILDDIKVKVEPITDTFDISTAAAVKEEPTINIPEPVVVSDGDDDDDAEEKVDLDEQVEVKSEIDIDWIPTTVCKSATASRKRKRVAKDDSTEVVASYGGKRKKKLYEETRAFRDPEMERNRQNAINAKKNRDRKKKERDALANQMEIVRRENTKLKSIIASKDKLLKKHGIMK